MTRLMDQYSIFFIIIFSVCLIEANLCVYIYIYIYIFFFYTCRSQTYSANEIDMVLAEDADTGKPIEWVDIDPEAFTGAMFTHFTIYFSLTHSLSHTHTHRHTDTHTHTHTYTHTLVFMVYGDFP